MVNAAHRHSFNNNQQGKPTSSSMIPVTTAAGAASRNNFAKKFLHVIIMCQWCITFTRSDYNVIIPELCTLPEPIGVNLTWIHEVVHSGLHHALLAEDQHAQTQSSSQILQQQKVKLNILGPEDICDGSQGLLQFISTANSDPSGQLIASLEPQLCPSAATFTHLRQKHFISWTCPKAPGIVSFKPMISEVIMGVQRLINQFDWNHIVFTKSKSDTSSFCDEVGSLLLQLYQFHDDEPAPPSAASDNEDRRRGGGGNTNKNNGGGTRKASIILLGNYEDFSKLRLPPVQDSILNNVDSVFVCMSYHHGLSLATDNLTGRKTSSSTTTSASSSFSQLKHKFTKFRRDDEQQQRQLPFILLPEWPLPIEILHPDLSLLAFVTDLHPYPYPSPVIIDADTNGESGTSSNTNEGQYGDSGQSRTANKLLEKLFAQLILRSVKVGIELSDRNGIQQSQKQQRETTTGQHQQSPSSASSAHHNGGGGGHHFSTKLLPFYFSVVHYENGRWHTVVNLSNEDNKLRTPSVHTSGSSSSSNKSPKERDIFSMSRSHKNSGQDDGTSPEDLVSWIHILLGTGITTLIIVSTVFVSIYFRNESRKKSFGGQSSSHRKLSRRQRVQGPYKIILTSQDIIFGPLPPPHANPTQDDEMMNEQNAGGGGVVAPPAPLPPSSRLPQFPSITRDGHSGGEDEKPDLLKGSHGTLRKSSSTNMTIDQIIVTGEYRARYKGDLVHLRKLDTNVDSLQIKTKAMGVLETLHGLRHENVNAMLGCLTQGIPSLVWEYCSRGSLYDIIQHTDIKLDWAFKLSLLTDLVRGMRYLHMSLVRVHGNLSSHNCVVDARWVLKITDYGLASFYEAQGLAAEYKSPKVLLWRAPELIRDENCKKFGTQPGDVYSFSIIVQEVLVRGEPYCMLALSPEEILEKVKRPPPLIRPSVSKGVAPPEAINIMRQCWAESPDMRPDFNMIHDLFKTLNHGRKANIVDTMFQMLEKYSNNLEELIRERTEQLDLEKKKTEQLLNRMLPSTVAEKLKLGLPVDPEEFSEVTIYFSDIVGFTTISAYSTPFEVVDLLNDLYTSFDATINDYNVYKVETIGDAYMVVGGAPVWSVDHADQIATMALDLLYQSGKFVIRHLPYTPLRLRIGLHTGPCCAGVVGLTMPRYCLFGDTVNTASRMESTGSAWRIHISGETKAKLEAIGGYVIQYRGMTDIKGKGQMPTFWLLGKEGFDRELPKPPGPKLDEKLIMYGRTGVMPDSIVRCASINDELEVTSSTGSVLGPSRYGATKPKYGLFSGDNVRGLSPAEQVAHQLLNGRPASRGLRRQFSLDQGTGVHHVTTSANSSFRKTPSLEEPNEHHSRSNAMLLLREDSSCSVPGGGKDIPIPIPPTSSTTYSSVISSLKGSQITPNVSTIKPILEVVSTPSTPCPQENEKDIFSHLMQEEFEQFDDDADSKGNNKSNNDSVSSSGAAGAPVAATTPIIHTCQRSSTKSQGKGHPALTVLEESPVLSRKDTT